MGVDQEGKKLRQQPQQQWRRRQEKRTKRGRQARVCCCWLSLSQAWKADAFAPPQTARAALGSLTPFRYQQQRRLEGQPRDGALAGTAAVLEREERGGRGGRRGRAGGSGVRGRGGRGEGAAPLPIMALNKAIERAGMQRDMTAVNEALVDLEKCVQPNVYTLNTLINACLRCRCEQDVIDSMWARLTGPGGGVEPNLISYNTLLKRYLKSKKGGARGKRQARAAALAGESKHLKEALELVDSMRGAGGVGVDMFTLNTLVNICTQSGDMAHAEALVGAMSLDGLRPNMHTMSLMLKGYGMQGEVQKAFDCLALMETSYGVTSNAFTYSVLLEACVSGGDPDRGVALMEQLLASELHDAALKKDAEGGGAGALAFLPKLDLTVFNSYVKVLRTCGGKVIESVAVLDTMASVGIKPDLTTFNTIIDSCCRERQLALAYEVRQRMRESTALHDSKALTTTYNILLRGHSVSSLRGGEGSLDGVLGALREMIEDGVEPDNFTCTLLVDACVKLGDPFRGIEEFVALRCERGLRPSAVAFNALLNAITEAMVMAKGGQMLPQVLRAVSLLARLGEQAAAESDADATLRHSPDAQEVMFMSPEDSVQLLFDEACKVISEYIPQCAAGGAAAKGGGEVASSPRGERGGGVKPDLWTYNSVIEAAAVVGKVAEAKRLYKEMQQAGWRPDGFTFHNLVRAHVVDGDSAAAAAVLMDMYTEKGLAGHPADYAIVLKSLSAVGEVETAKVLFQQYRSMTEENRLGGSGTEDGTSGGGTAGKNNNAWRRGGVERGAAPIDVWNAMLQVYTDNFYVGKAAHLFLLHMRSRMPAPAPAAPVAPPATAAVGAEAQQQLVIQQQDHVVVRANSRSYSIMARAYFRDGLMGDCLTLMREAWARMAMDADQEEDVGDGRSSRSSSRSSGGSGFGTGIDTGLINEVILSLSTLGDVGNLSKVLQESQQHQAYTVDDEATAKAVAGVYQRLGLDLQMVTRKLGASLLLAKQSTAPPPTTPPSTRTEVP